MTSRYDYMKLYNPYHDELGRFSSKRGGGAVVQSLKVSKDGRLERAWTAAEDKVFSPVAKFLSREGFRYSVLRFGIDIGIDRALYTLAGVHVTQAATLLGTAAATALIGGSLAPVLAGVGAGLVDTMIWYTISERYTDKLFYGFVNKYNDSSKTGRVVGMTSVGKLGRKLAWLDRMTLAPADIFEFIGTMIISGKGKAVIDAMGSDSGATSGLIMTGSEMASHAATAPGIMESILGAAGGVALADPYDILVPADVRPVDGNEPDADWAKMASMYPYVKNVNLGLTSMFAVPASEATAGLDEIGFTFAGFKDLKLGNGLFVMDKAGSNVFLKNYDNHTAPKIGKFVFFNQALEDRLSPYAV